MWLRVDSKTYHRVYKVWTGCWCMVNEHLTSHHPPSCTEQHRYLLHTPWARNVQRKKIMLNAKYTIGMISIRSLVGFNAGNRPYWNDVTVQISALQPGVCERVRVCVRACAAACCVLLWCTHLDAHAGLSYKMATFIARKGVINSIWSIGQVCVTKPSNSKFSSLYFICIHVVSNFTSNN